VGGAAGPSSRFSQASAEAQASHAARDRDNALRPLLAGRGIALVTNDTEGNRPGDKKTPDSLIRVVRASERQQKAAPKAEKPAETLPVELLAGRKRPAPKGRFVTGGKLERDGAAGPETEGPAKGAKAKPRFVGRPGLRSRGGRPPRGAGKPRR
jgi:hypothetical protein